MKIKCDVCKTEYNLDANPASPVQCVVCGNVWRVALESRKNSLLMFFASLCALLSAIIFTVAVITQHKIKQASVGPLIANVTSVTTTTDDVGKTHVVVSGNVKNISDKT